MPAQASTPPPGAVDNGDGTYSYPDPDSYQPGDPLTIGPVDYEFVGLMRYGYDPEPSGPYVYSQPTGWVDHAPRAVILRGEFVDELHRIWHPVDVDDALLLAEVQAWEASTPIDWPATTSLPLVDLAYEQGGSWQFEPESYRSPTCSTGVHHPWDYRIHTADDRVITNDLDPATWDAWQKQTVAVEWRVSSTERAKCTGSLIGSHWVLTAAHCVWNRRGQGNHQLDVADTNLELRVCTNGSLTAAGAVCREVTRIHAGPWGRWGWQPQDDYALLHLAGPGLPGPYMTLSGDSLEKVRDQYMVHARTYPVHRAVPWVSGSTPTCTDNSVAPGTTTPNMVAWPNNFRGMPARESLSTPSNVTKSVMRTTLDGGEGDSGAPWFRCHGFTGSCETGEAAYQTAVWAGYNPIAGRRVGAFVPRIRPWAYSCMGRGGC